MITCSRYAYDIILPPFEVRLISLNFVPYRKPEINLRNFFYKSFKPVFDLNGSKSAMLHIVNFLFYSGPDCEIRDMMLLEQQKTAWIFTSSLLGKKTKIYCIYYNHNLVLILLLLATKEKPMELLTRFSITAHQQTFSTRNTKIIIARDTSKATISIKYTAPKNYMWHI